MTMCVCGRGEAVMQGICRSCWATRMGAARRSRIWTPALHTELRLAYTLPKPARKDAITALVKKTGWRHHAFYLEAQRLDLITSKRRPWTKAEDKTLTAVLGELNVHQIAKLLNRSHESVKARAERLEMSIRVRDGYCITDLAKIFGVPRYRVHEWIDKGLLGKPLHFSSAVRAAIRVADYSVTKFIKSNPHLIDFRLADQTFLKGVLYGPDGA